MENAKSGFLSIALITFVVLSLALGFIFSRDLFRLFFSSPRFQITSLVQHARSEDFIPTAFLEELLDLSEDHPLILYTADTKEMENKLMASQAIKWAKVEKRGLNQLYIEYEMRAPFAKVMDFENSFIDQEGTLFPAHPYYSPKRLPEIYFGEDKPLSEVWGSSVDSQKMMIATELIRLFKSERVKMIDLSHLSEPSLGHREIDLVLNDGKILRLPSSHYLTQLKNFAYLKKYYLKQNKESCIIDLRLSNSAYLENMLIQKTTLPAHS